MNQQPASAEATRPARLLESSYRFHEGLEHLGDFVRRESRTISAASAAYLAIILTLLFLPDPAFFYPRVESDQLQYLLKAQALVETGTTATARHAVNLKPFSYAAMPGILRAPFLFLFDDFDLQLRGIQLMNVAVTALSAILSAYILSWALPPKLHKLAIVYAFGFALLSPDWFGNTLVPLADGIYAAVTLGCLVLVCTIMTSPRPQARAGPIFLLVLLFAIAFFVRVTAPVVLLSALLLGLGRWDIRRVPPKVLAATAAAAVVVLGGFVALNSDAIFGRYLAEPITLFKVKSGLGMLFNLFASSIPSNIIPVFAFGFEVATEERVKYTLFRATPRDFVWGLAGLMISAVVIRGMILSRRRFAPEFAAVIAALPVLTILAYSTTRYLMSYQPIIWICFFAGLMSLTEKWTRHASRKRIRSLVAVSMVIAITAVVAIRSARTAATAGAATQGRSIAASVAYINEVGHTFRGLRSFLEGLPRESTLLVGTRGNFGRFKVIANRDYYSPDSGFVRTARESNVYAVVTCATALECTVFDREMTRQTARISRFGQFSYEPVYDEVTPNARAFVRRLIPVEPEPGT